MYRDALVLALGADVELVNEDLHADLTRLTQAMTAEQVLVAMDAIATARERIDANVPPLLALEAMAVSLRLPRR